MDAAVNIYKISETLAKGHSPVVDLMPIRGKLFKEFVIVNIIGSPPTDILGWEMTNKLKKMQIQLKDVTIQKAYPVINTPLSVNMDPYTPFDILTADTD